MAHGRSCSQKLLPWRGITLLSGAQTALAYGEINTLPQRPEVRVQSPEGSLYPRSAVVALAGVIHPASTPQSLQADPGQFW